MMDEDQPKRLTKELSEKLFGSLSLPVVICNHTGIISSNPAFKKRFGLTLGSGKRKNFLKLLPEDTRAKAESRLRHREEAPVLPPIFEVEITLENEDGSSFILTEHLIDYENEPALLYIINEVAEEKTLRALVFRKEKMSVIGALTAGVAHEFNNVLGGILGYAELAGENPRFVNKLLEVIASQGERAKLITDGLLNFSRRDEYREELVNLSLLVDEVVNILEKTFAKEGIKINRDYHGSYDLFTSPGKIQQVVVNIMLNARETIGKNGEIDLEIKGAASNVFISIKDNGCGLSAGMLRNIFASELGVKRFSELDNSTDFGLRLFYSENLLKSLGGRLKAKSKPGVGSEFTIVLPWKKNWSEDLPLREK